MPVISISGRLVQFDDQDAELISANKWFIRERIDPKRALRLYVTSHRLELMHRMIVCAPKGSMVDHINGDPLDNRRTNLRIVDARGNAHNQRKAHRNSKTGFLGVDHLPSKYPNRPYRAQIKVGGKKLHLGQFETPEAAHAAYVEAKRVLHEGNTL